MARASPTRWRRWAAAPAEVSWRAGVDVLSFGGVKNGLAAGEAVVFFDQALAHEFEWRVKQAGQLKSKMRLVTAPWVGLLEGDVWLANARHANAMAQRLAERITKVEGVRLLAPVERRGIRGTRQRRAGPAAPQGLALLRVGAGRLPPDVCLGYGAGDRRSLRCGLGSGSRRVSG